jgi:phosphate/sulfate permease
MDVNLLLTVFVLVVGFYMAWNIGAQDVSNAMGTSVGSGALTMLKAVIIAAILEFCGAYFVGSSVSKTIQQGLIDTSLFTENPMVLVLGMCGDLLGTGIWLQVASFFGWPVSTTHAIVGAIVGFGGIIGGMDAIQWPMINSILLSWVLSPVASGIIAYLVFTILQRKILFTLNPTAATIKIFPLLTFIFFGSFSLNLIFNGLSNLNLPITFFQAFLLSLLIATVAAGITFVLVRKVPLNQETAHVKIAPQAVISLDKALKHLQRAQLSTKAEFRTKVSDLLDSVRDLSEEVKTETGFEKKTSVYRDVEKMFAVLQIFSASFIAFSHGSNDVANAIGPIAAVLDVLKNNNVTNLPPIPTWLLALGGGGIVLGLATWGWRVIETIGKKITALTPTRGFSAEFGAATTILFASKLGLPVSTTHCLVGAVLGVGFARGLNALNMRTVRDIVLSWIVTLPVSAFISILMFYILKAIFL